MESSRSRVPRKKDERRIKVGSAPEDIIQMRVPGFFFLLLLFFFHSFFLFPGELIQNAA